MRSLGCLALALLILIPISLTADSRLTLPIDADRLHQFLSENGITTKRGLLRALPDQVARRVLLISDSHSLHRSTPALPRVVHWSPDARFIMSISGQNVGDAPHAGTIEMIQVNERTQDWQFLTMNATPDGFTPPRDVTRQCSSCHGERPRPIWGQYPDWPHAYGGSLGHEGVDAMTEEERNSFWEFIASTREHDAYADLNIRLTMRGFSLRIPYGLPNTHFGARLGTRHAKVMFDRIRQSPEYGELAPKLMRVSRHARCGSNRVVDALVDQAYRDKLTRSPEFATRWGDDPTDSAQVQLYRLLGIDPYQELRLDVSPTTPVDPGSRDPEGLAWNAGGDGVSGLVEFLVFYDLLQQDPDLQRWFASRMELIEGTHWAAFEASAEEVVAMSLRRTGADRAIKALDYERAELTKRGATGGALASIDRELAAAWRLKHERRDYFSNGLFPFLHFNIFAPVVEDSYSVYVPMEGDGHKQAICDHLTQNAIAS